MGGKRGNNKRGQKSLMLKVNMSNDTSPVVSSCSLKAAGWLFLKHTIDKVNVVSALSTLNVAPNTKGKEKSTEEHDRRGDIWADLGVVPTRSLYMKSANFLIKIQFSGKLLPHLETSVPVSSPQCTCL